MLSGPNSYAVDVQGTDTLRGLDSGTYVLSNDTATASDAIVTPLYVGSVIGSPATIAVAETARMSASFTVLPGSGQLWIGGVTGGSGVLSGFTSTQLTGTGVPGTTLSAAGGDALFDATGNLWVADSAANTIVEYPAAGLATSGAPTASVTITSAGLNGPVGLIFDRLGDLWVTNPASNTLVQYSAAQLVAGGNLTPAVTVTRAALNAPARIAFDTYGNLWVPNAGSNTVVAFAPAQLTSTDTTSPRITLSATGGSLAGPRAVAFDESGNLWVANATGNTIVAYDYAHQLHSGSPTPVITFALPGTSNGPSVLAFDNSGDLWGISATGSNLFEYSAQQISAYGAAAPVYTVVLSNRPTSLAFDPRPDGIPLVGPTGRRLRGHSITLGFRRGSTTSRLP